MITTRKTKGGKWRLFDGNVIAKTKNGVPCDGGGHKFKTKADRQAGYINASIEK